MSTSSSSGSNPDLKPTANRWWEVYIIRYFVGTVIGGAVLLFLNNSSTSLLRTLLMPGITDISKLDMQLLILLGAMGLAFCYISSAPVLVLHASRAAFLRSNRGIFNWIFGCIVGLIFLIGAGFYIWSSFQLVIISSSLALALVISLQVVPLVFSLKDDGELTHKYYEKLTKARIRGTAEHQEYKESYRHLREHGNAFLILFFEIVFGIVLAGSPSAAIATIALILWILPAAIVWFSGSVLEYRFSHP
jgi:hypothetical protein